MGEQGLREEVVYYRFKPGEKVWCVVEGRFVDASTPFAVCGPRVVRYVRIEVGDAFVMRRYNVAVGEPDVKEEFLFRTEEAAIAEAFLRNEIIHLYRGGASA